MGGALTDGALTDGALTDGALTDGALTGGVAGGSSTDWVFCEGDVFCRLGLTGDGVVPVLIGAEF